MLYKTGVIPRKHPLASWPAAPLDLCLLDKSASSAWLARCLGIVCYLIRRVFQEQTTLSRIASKARASCFLA